MKELFPPIDEKTSKEVKNLFKKAQKELQKENNKCEVARHEVFDNPKKLHEFISSEIKVASASSYDAVLDECFEVGKILVSKQVEFSEEEVVEVVSSYSDEILNKEKQIRKINSKRRELQELKQRKREKSVKSLVPSDKK